MQIYTCVVLLQYRQEISTAVQTAVAASKNLRQQTQTFELVLVEAAARRLTRRAPLTRINPQLLGMSYPRSTSAYKFCKVTLRDLEEEIREAAGCPSKETRFFLGRWSATFLSAYVVKGGSSRC